MPGLTEIAELDPVGELLLATARGDRRALARVYQLSASRLYPVALRILGQREAAEEVLQEAFVQIWRKAGQYRPDRGRPLAWMAAVVRNCAIDRRRAESRRPRETEPWDESMEPPVDPATAQVPHHLTATLRTCLERLEINQRNAILLAYYYGMSHEELAARLDSPLGTVKTWVRRGLLKLRECLEP